MTEFSGRTLFMLCLLICSVPNHNCRYNRKNLPLSRRIIENVTLSNYKEKLDEINLQNERNLEFRNLSLPYSVDVEEILRALNSTKSITFRRGRVGEFTILSPRLEVLQVINTDLFQLTAIPSQNYSLRQLTVRSKRFHEWSPSLMVLQALEEIDIAYCGFSYLDMEWFKPFPRLRVLDVAKNRLAELDIRPTSSFGVLKKLHLWGNRLEWVPRFPDAFPALDSVSLSQNRWNCGWLSKVRDAIWSRGVALMDMDGDCQPGWVNNGGLCCRSSGIRMGTRIPKWNVAVKDIYMEMKKTEDILEKAEIVNGSVIGMQLGNSIVFLDKPLKV